MDRESEGTLQERAVNFTGDFRSQITSALEAMQHEITDLAHSRQSFEADESLERARKLVSDFRPVPQIIWRLSNYAIGRAGHINRLTSGHVFGLKKLVLHIGGDPIIGLGHPVTSTNEVLTQVDGDVIAAASIIYAVSRRLQGMPFAHLWQPMFIEGLLRANLGFCVGQMSESFGVGRSMLAGFAGRIGMIFLIASGSEHQAQEFGQLRACTSDPYQAVCDVYGCVPEHVSAMVLSAAGCSKDAVLGVVALGLSKQVQAGLDSASALWLAALKIIDDVFSERFSNIEEATWLAMGFDATAERDELAAILKTIKRRGNTWDWMTEFETDPSRP